MSNTENILRRAAIVTSALLLTIAIVVFVLPHMSGPTQRVEDVSVQTTLMLLAWTAIVLYGAFVIHWRYLRHE